MTSITVVLAIISLNLSFIGNYLMRICRYLERKENFEEDDKKGGE